MVLAPSRPFKALSLLLASISSLFAAFISSLAAPDPYPMGAHVDTSAPAAARHGEDGMVRVRAWTEQL